MAIVSKDSLRSSIEASTGGLCTVLYDAKGHPNIMRRISKFKIEDVLPDLGLTGTHPAFIVNGVEKPELFISVYANTVVDNVGVSLPGLDPAVNMTFDQAVAYCDNKGPGWHLMSNAEWAALQALALASDFQPHGNTYWGLNYDLKYETGTLAPGASNVGVRDDSKHGRTLTGSGPLSWRHDNSPAGIADLVGNVWEWTAGLRINAGEINIIPDNDVAAGGSQAANSSLWKAILQNGNLASPGAADTLKYDAAGANGTGAVVLNKAISSQYPSPDTTASSTCAFKSVTAKAGVTVPAIMKMLGLYPVDTEKPVGQIWHRNSGERLPLRGGDYNNNSNCGLFALNLNNNRTNYNRNVGFRSALVLIRQKPCGYGCRDGTGTKGGHFRPH